MKKSNKRILLLDFDGVIHSYKSGWKGARNIPDLPVPGALEFIVTTTEHFDVCIYSARSGQFGGIAAMRKWLKKQYLEISSIDKSDRWHIPRPNLEIPEWWFNWISHTAFADPWDEEVRWAVKMLFKMIRFPKKKPAAFLTIDDRCFLFKGLFPSMEEIANFKPWYNNK